MPDERRFDMEFRPEDYFEPEDRTAGLLGRITGTARRKAAAEAIARGEHVPDYILAESLEDGDRAAVSRIDPHLMGGEYLPPLWPGEVEIARFEYATLGSDVISVRARPGKNRIRYRVVDEYPGEEERRVPRKSSRRPLTLRQLVDLVDGSDFECEHSAKGGLVVSWLEANEYRKFSLDECTGSFSVESRFYPELAGWYAEVAKEWHAETQGEPGGAPPPADAVERADEAEGRQAVEPAQEGTPSREVAFWASEIEAATALGGAAPGRTSGPASGREAGLPSLCAALGIGPDDILRASDPPLTEEQAREIVAGLEREGRMPSPEELETAMREVFEELARRRAEALLAEQARVIVAQLEREGRVQSPEEVEGALAMAAWELSQRRGEPETSLLGDASEIVAGLAREGRIPSPDDCEPVVMKAVEHFERRREAREASLVLEPELACALRWHELVEFRVARESGGAWVLLAREEGDDERGGLIGRLEDSDLGAREAAKLLVDGYLAAEKVAMSFEVEPTDGLLTAEDLEELSEAALERGRAKYKSMMWQIGWMLQLAEDLEEPD